MALEWVVLGYAAAAEAVMVLLLTVPGLGPLRKGLVAVIRNLLKPFLSIVPFCLFLFMDIYWKYENRPSCASDSCTPTEHLRHQKSIMKSQRNMLLIVSALPVSSATERSMPPEITWHVPLRLDASELLYFDLLMERSITKVKVYTKQFFLRALMSQADWLKFFATGYRVSVVHIATKYNPCIFGQLNTRLSLSR
ncbi:hypothetical protein Ccrd_001702 [Cynara cardunculus var. scolymus]|uniref:Endoplasmic reticulum transmembrane protein n=1 Tax=Cynara cardunculus var. scolymus TaxID=59895 RepID=A0A103XSS6_CYNCS|nr:hypothetical protein Ccrd_001702 [Cynara cardunculus var. scolymus]